ncbi:MAG TPA: hypothetical protein VIM22_00910, partial [Solirubrobacteraceae bacterium]
MPTRGTARARTPAVIVLLLLALAGAPAQAASRPASAVITSCKVDHLTVAGAVKLTGKAAGKARGAKLQLQFQALPLFGLPKSGAWRDIGTKVKGSGQETFAGLGAGSWAGLMRWRFKKGARTVLSGGERSQPGRAGGAKGAGFCTLDEGLKPIDATPPQLAISPEDAIWRRGPAQVTLSAQDEFSGVRSVSYSLDGGPATAIRNNSSFPIDTEGAHSLTGSATDVAGNTATRNATVRVDQSAPTKPQVTRPFSVTVSTTPVFQWSASTDSGSGLRGYLLAITRASDGQLISLTPIDPAATSAPSPQALEDGQSYIVTVVVLD